MRVDKKNIELIKRGDRKIIEELYLSYYKLVKYKIYEIVKNNEDAEELTQNVFVKVFSKIEQYDPSMNFVTWLIKVATNTAKDHLRLKTVDVEYMDDVSHLSTEDGEERGDLDDKIKALLSDEEYTIVTYRIYFDFKFTDIARMLNSSLPIITGKYYRAIGKLKKTLKEEDFYD